MSHQFLFSLHSDRNFLLNIRIFEKLWVNSILGKNLVNKIFLDFLFVSELKSCNNNRAAGEEGSGEGRETLTPGYQHRPGGWVPSEKHSRPRS